MLSLFISQNTDGTYALTSAGTVSIAIILFLLLVAAASLSRKGKGFGTKQLVFSAVAIALAFVTSMIKLFDMPMGGSVTLFSMFFITLVASWYGPASGIMVGVAYGLLQFIIDPYIVSLPQVLVDYPLAFGALGIAGFFAGQKYGLITGYIAGVLGRFVFSFLSGYIFFGMYAPEGMHPAVYSAAYNGAYLAAEAVLTIVILAIPAIRNALSQAGTMARS